MCVPILMTLPLLFWPAVWILESGHDNDNLHRIKDDFAQK